MNTNRTHGQNASITWREVAGIAAADFRRTRSSAPAPQVSTRLPLPAGRPVLRAVSIWLFSSVISTGLLIALLGVNLAHAVTMAASAAAGASFGNVVNKRGQARK